VVELMPRLRAVRKARRILRQEPRGSYVRTPMPAAPGKGLAGQTLASLRPRLRQSRCNDRAARYRSPVAAAIKEHLVAALLAMTVPSAASK
jgi:hypothetical protein